MRKLKSTAFFLSALGATGLADVTAAWAGGVPGAPGPLAGVGLPALAAGACGYWIFRKIRDRSRSD